jgi:uncharacterized membrane protein YphA (DoxX/SURF4 family)
MSLASNFKQPSYLGYMAIVRIMVGYHFLTAAWPKVTGDFLNGKRLPAQLMRTVTKDPFGWHRDFIHSVVIPHPHFFSYLVAFGELAIAISLLTGCLVRVSAAFAAFHNLNIYLAVAYFAGGSQAGLNRLFIVLDILFVIAAAGRALGLDGLLKERFPRTPLF